MPFSASFVLESLIFTKNIDHLHIAHILRFFDRILTTTFGGNVFLLKIDKPEREDF